MVTIKEKAEENCIKYGNLGNVAYQEFVAGANYVLDEIEKLIYEKQVEGNLPLFDLTHLIDKLKEK